MSAQEERDRIRRDYRVEDGLIRSHGKFEGEPEFAPYYWNLVLDGSFPSASDENYTYDYADVSAEERVAWPELEGVTGVVLFEDDQGFVHCSTVSVSFEVWAAGKEGAD